MKNNKSSFYIAIIALLSLSWALVDVFLGGWIKSLHLVWAGIFLSFFSIFIFILGKKLIPVFGSVMLIGILAAFFKFLLTDFATGPPFYALLIEALIGELCLTILDVKRFSSVILGILVVNYTAFHPLFQMGGSLNCRYIIIFKRMSLSFFSNEFTSTISMTIYYLLIHIIIGIISGLIAWYISNLILIKLKR